jgi:hypothetical protein
VAVTIGNSLGALEYEEQKLLPGRVKDINSKKPLTFQ